MTGCWSSEIDWPQIQRRTSACLFNNLTSVHLADFTIRWHNSTNESFRLGIIKPAALPNSFSMPSSRSDRKTVRSKAKGSKSILADTGSSSVTPRYARRYGVRGLLRFVWQRSTCEGRMSQFSKRLFLSSGSAGTESSSQRMLSDRLSTLCKSPPGLQFLSDVQETKKTPGVQTLGVRR